ncbi:LytTR family transcriptional regulator DNA-binding domain-containing protein [Flavobacterium sp. FlaQc-50]
MDQLPKDEFIQVHKSFAVTPKHIKSIEGNQIGITNYQDI